MITIDHRWVGQIIRYYREGHTGIGVLVKVFFRGGTPWMTVENIIVGGRSDVCLVDVSTIGLYRGQLVRR